MTSVESIIARAKGGAEVETDDGLSDDQRAGMRWLYEWYAGDQVCAVLEGYAGTGKTFLVTRWASDIRKHFEPAERPTIALAAPTNKAVGVLEEKCGTGLPAMEGEVTFATIHGLLGLRVVDRDDGTQTVSRGGESSIAQYDLVLIDEASMVDAELINRLLEAKRARTKILFVGDPAQLAPVSDGAMSPVFDPDAFPHRFRLESIVRQARGNPIIAASIAARHAVQEGRALTLGALLAALPPGHESHLSIGNISAIDWCADALENELDARILAFSNDAVIRANQALHWRLHPDAPLFAPGEPVIANEQCQGRVGLKVAHIRNGEVMSALSCEEKENPDDPSRAAYRVICKRDEGADVELWVAKDAAELQRDVRNLFAEFAKLKAAGDLAGAKAASGKAWWLKRLYAPLRHAYALTIHKSQGSTFDVALIDWASINAARDPVQRSRLLYVAITRPAKYLVVCTG